MSQDVTKQHYSRRQIRKINREARGEYRKPGQILAILLLLLCTTIFVVVEVFGITRAKHTHDQALAKDLTNDALIELSIANASFVSGDRPLLVEARQKYRKTLDEFNNNAYMQQSQADLLRQLNDYGQILANEEECVRFINLRTAIVMLQKELQDVDTKKVSAETLIGIKENLEDFRNSISELDSARLAPLVAELIEYSDELIKLVDKTSVCVGTCTEASYKTRYDELEKVFTNFHSKLAQLDAQTSEYYSPSNLVEALKVLQ